MDSQELTQMVMKNLAEGIERATSAVAGKKVGFVLMVFPFDESKRLNYISNGDRDHMRKVLRELLNRWEQGDKAQLTHLN